jgi:hypothetical protein
MAQVVLSVTSAKTEAYLAYAEFASQGTFAWANMSVTALGALIFHMGVKVWMNNTFLSRTAS